ncbi:probable protein S-acyltransferase 22 isoform X1 [Phragmites australis]|uniref:probable protein S-acyltransferase 22 isoform X1 n=1 Tax=Phragmites australis TaxID=29695 RepID=UPI002D77F59A|nr:probable protein S-acyltransferase 22 isoform X1 [Phragmites australis]
MRKHGWQLPYHPLQVVAIAVFAALGFAYYVFVVPFVGTKTFQIVAMAIYTPLITCVVVLYIWCAATNPGDPGIFSSTRHPKLDKDEKQSQMDSNHGHGGRPLSEGFGAVDNSEKLSSMLERKDSPSWPRFSGILCLICFPLSCLCKRCLHSDDQTSEQNISEEGMFFCSLCEAEVLKNSKHCRVCDKCVDGFDHHCRWLNNCIGKRNYKGFFVLMASAVALLVMQWLSGVLVLILCIVKRGEFSRQIVTKLGSSFSTVAFVVVVATCTILAMVATIPLAQLLCFHILLIKKGISTYDYIIALREQEDQQEVPGHQSPQMSIISSVTGFSTASSFGPLHRGSWCTPPRLFLEDQFDVIPPEVGMSQNSGNKKTKEEEGARRKPGTVKISPWTLARLNAEEVSKAAAQARKKSKILKPIAKHDAPDNGIKPNNKRRPDKRGHFPAERSLDPLATLSASGTESHFSDAATEISGSLAPLQLEARSAFQPSTAASTRNVASSPESSFDSPDLHPFRISSSTADDMQGVLSHPAHKGIEFTRSSSDGYEASGGEDSDRIPSRIVHRSSNWANAILNSGQGGPSADLHIPASEGFHTDMKSS